MTLVGALGVALAGGAGALLRVELTALSDRLGRGPRPGTLAANLLGTVVLAWLVVAADDAVLLVVGGGFCGALTTFSTWVGEAAADVLGRPEPDEGTPGSDWTADRRTDRSPWLVATTRLVVGLGVGVAIAWLLLAD